MSGIFNTMNTATKGLMAQQTSIHTVGHNLTNANTPGYSRQRVDTQADLAYNLAGVGQLGTGVKMVGIVRMVNDYVNNQIMEETGTMERFDVKSQTMGQLEIIFNEPSKTGLSFNLGKMFDSFQELSKNPESLNAKTVVVEQAKTLAATLNHMSNQIEGLRNNTLDEIEKNASDFNSIVDRLETLNKQIFNVAIKGHTPNDLLDQRDLMMKELSGITEFKHKFDDYGRVEISVGNETILPTKSVDDDGNEVVRQELSMVTGIEKNVGEDGFKVLLSDGETYNVEKIEEIEVGNIVIAKPVEHDEYEYKLQIVEPKTGKLKGYQESLGDIEARKKNLDDFAKYMAEAVNIVHRGGVDGDLDKDFFKPSFGDTEINAGNIQVNDKITEDNSKVNAGKDTEGNGPEGDGSRALAIASLRNTKISFTKGSTIEYYEDPVKNTMGIKEQLGGTTIEGAYIDIVTKVGVSKQHADQMVDNQEVLLGQLEFRRESTSGVSIDEEVGNLVQFQKAYEANAKMISVLAEMLDVLINRTGV